MRLSTVLRHSRGGESGQGMAEYALILTLVGAAAITLLIFFGDSMGAMMSYLGNAL